MSQPDWRFCSKCFVMFYAGDQHSNMGQCQAGGGHQGYGFNFVLPHDTPEIAFTQKDWRFCQKCFVMFYAGDQHGNMGQCRGGGGHQAYGFNFVLPHTAVTMNLTLDARPQRNQLGATVYMSGQGYTPGGTVNFAVRGLAGFSGEKAIGVVINAKGDGTFSNVQWDGKTWSGGGTAALVAYDRLSGRSVTAPIPALY